MPSLLHCTCCCCSKRLAKMISTMRERLSAKLGNNNDNAFKMRKLFKMYDRKEVGTVRQHCNAVTLLLKSILCFILHWPITALAMQYEGKAVCRLALSNQVCSL